MKNKIESEQKNYLGEEPPLLSKRANQTLERRDVSFKWLSGTVLTAIASITLMGGALFAALDGRQILTIPAQAYKNDSNSGAANRQLALKGGRPGLALSKNVPADNNILMVPTVSREGTRDVVKTKPFLHLMTPLAVAAKSGIDYPAFNPLAIFSSGNEPELIARSTGLIYGADVEGEVTFTTTDFPYDNSNISFSRKINSDDIETLVRNTAPQLNIGSTSVVSVAYFDPRRFRSGDDAFLSSSDAIVTAENVSTLSRTTNNNYGGIYYEERLIRIRNQVSISQALKDEGIHENEAFSISDAVSSNFSSNTLNANDRLRIFYRLINETQSQLASRTVARLSVYRAGTHLVSIAQAEDGSFKFAKEPSKIPELSTPDKETIVAQASLPTTYDAIYRAALNEGVTKELAKELIRIVAFDVDFKTRVKPNDALSVFMTLQDGDSEPNANSEILYTGLKLGNVIHRYYRFADPQTGVVDYYDETGKSAKQFLLREPVPTGKFRSGFGMRRHPITRVRRMHTGVDWSAPRGTPILAAGNGVVEKAGWHSGGYGRQTIVKHANGYKSSYNHQYKFAKGIVAGSRVRQGQVIGFVGSTGLSTGPHLHYELIVNGAKVNPMRIKLPSGKVLKDAQLAAFISERDRIDALLKERQEENQMVLALN
ncbi:MAG: M23 family metallopeptidase [Nitratireductor sp.]